MFFMTLIILIIVGVIDFFISKRYAMSEKVDRGFELCYWKLSYRRKFVRTLWLIPISVFLIVEFHRTFQSVIFTAVIGIMVFILTFIQAFYNYKKWKKEKWLENKKAL